MQPTWITFNIANVPDLILTTTPDLISPISLLPGISDHLLLHFYLNILIKHNIKEIRTIWDHKNADFVGISNHLCTFLDNFVTIFSPRSVGDPYLKTKFKG